MPAVAGADGRMAGFPRDAVVTAGVRRSARAWRIVQACPKVQVLASEYRGVAALRAAGVRPANLPGVLVRLLWKVAVIRLFRYLDGIPSIVGGLVID
ncbi:hypothetical protein [Frankia sp. Cj3]|uniref:hypothetical protein n=1 Tax=Frankia sp. Cj3 TaxID=2880976 RepID=UPI001EF65C62|nr:hypothetical protein [Frankia sp. Cj3]